MPRWEDQVLDEYRRPVAGALVYVFTSDGADAAELTADGGAPLENPVETDTYGGYYFNVADIGRYLLEVHYGGETEYKLTVDLGPDDGGGGGFSLLIPEIVTGTSYTLKVTDRYAAKRLVNPALTTIFVPLNLTVAVPIGARCRVGVEGAAGAIVVESVGVTIVCRNDLRNAAPGSVFELHKVATDGWWLLGDVQ